MSCFVYLQGGTAEISLSKGDILKLTTDKAFFAEGDNTTLYVDYENITKVMKEGGIIYVDDGLISLKVREIGSNYLLVEVLNDSKLGSKKGVNLPNVEVDLPAVSEQDKKDILFGVKHEVGLHSFICFLITILICCGLLLKRRVLNDALNIQLCFGIMVCALVCQSISFF